MHAPRLAARPPSHIRLARVSTRKRESRTSKFARPVSDYQPPRTPPGRFDTHNRRNGQYVAIVPTELLEVLIQSRRIQELVPAQPVEEEPQERVRITPLMTRTRHGDLLYLLHIGSRLGDGEHWLTVP
jgi:hypothetical protein